MEHVQDGRNGKSLTTVYFIDDQILGIYDKRPTYRHQGTLPLQLPARIAVLHDLAEASGSSAAIFLCHFSSKNRGPGPTLFQAINAEDPVVTKNRLVRAIADRCLAGEFGGSYFCVAKEPECVELCIIHSHIKYHMDQKCSLVALDRAADRRGSLLRRHQRG
jgi:hypothetical protein